MARLTFSIYVRQPAPCTDKDVDAINIERTAIIRLLPSYSLFK